MNEQHATTPQANILIVDDALTNLQLLRTLLSGCGYTVRAARNGAFALNSARLCAPDLILLDVEMPGMSGYEVCKELKADERTRHIPVIFISARDDDPREKARAFAAGGIDYIIKPFHIDDVVARVAATITNR